MRASRSAGWLGGATLIAALAGCAAAGPREASLEPNPGLYDEIHVSYRTQTDQVNALAAHPAFTGRLVSYQQPVGAPLPDHALGNVEIIFPHPDKAKAGLAQVKVTIETRPDGQASAVRPASFFQRWWQSTQDDLPGLKGAGWSQETWMLDIGRWELDQIMASLRQNGFTNQTEATNPSAYLDVQHNQVSYRKNWEQVPELDTLVLRARSEGTLASATHPLANSATTAAVTALTSTIPQPLPANAAEVQADPQARAATMTRLPTVNTAP